MVFEILYLIDNNEKETGFQGIINMINLNPDNGFGGLSTQHGKKFSSIFSLY